MQYNWSVINDLLEDGIQLMATHMFGTYAAEPVFVVAQSVKL